MLTSAASNSRQSQPALTTRGAGHGHRFTSSVAGDDYPAKGEEEYLIILIAQQNDHQLTTESDSRSKQLESGSHFLGTVLH